jgi:hypothetical protein
MKIDIKIICYYFVLSEKFENIGKILYFHKFTSCILLHEIKKCLKVISKL